MQTLGTNDSIGNSEGDGDLLDDFVLTAAARVYSVPVSLSKPFCHMQCLHSEVYR
jgi:hypothetical protein